MLLVEKQIGGKAVERALKELIITLESTQSYIFYASNNLRTLLIESDKSTILKCLSQKMRGNEIVALHIISEHVACPRLRK